MKPLAIGWLWVLVAAAPSVWAFSPPAPEHVPDSITVRGKTLPLRTLQNPFRQEGVPSPAPVQEGARLYMENCLLCHGDLLDGRGLFADRFFPPPANFHSPASLRGRPEYYGFWRIMKGGPGLPDQYEPWNSAMPAWENTLTEEQVWKVLLFIYDRIWHPGSQPPSPQPSAARGAEVYQEKCVHCHGPKGKGDGTAAAYSSPRPRNLTKGHYKFRSTPFGKIPTDQDLHDMLTRGMPGTTMPSWKHLPETDLLSLVAYLKVLGKKKFDRAKRKKKIPQAVPVPEPPPFTLESKERGRALFIQNCSGCHGVRGRGDGDATKKIVDIASDAIRPRNLTKPWTFRRGFSRKDLFLTLRTGLSTTAMPRFSPRIHNDGNLWNIVNYVETLSPGQKPDIERKLHAIQVSGRLPEVPEDPAWGEIPTYFIPLGGQIMQGKEKAYFPTVDNVWVQAMHNGKEIALRVRWDDPTFDPILKKSATVEESPPPPLPLEFQVDASELDPPPPLEPAPFPDSLTIQLAPGAGRDGRWPYFLNGEDTRPVTLWKWQSNPNKVTVLSARGLGRETVLRKPTVASKVLYRYGQYTLVLNGPLSPTSLGGPGSVHPLAVQAQDGAEKETGGKRAVSSWFELVLDRN